MRSFQHANCLSQVSSPENRGPSQTPASFSICRLYWFRLHGYLIYGKDKSWKNVRWGAVQPSRFLLSAWGAWGCQSSMGKAMKRSPSR